MRSDTLLCIEHAQPIGDSCGFYGAFCALFSDNDEGEESGDFCCYFCVSILSSFILAEEYELTFI